MILFGKRTGRKLVEQDPQLHIPNFKNLRRSLRLYGKVQDGFCVLLIDPNNVDILSVRFSRYLSSCIYPPPSYKVKMLQPATACYRETCASSSRPRAQILV